MRSSLADDWDPFRVCASSDPKAIVAGTRVGLQVRRIFAILTQVALNSSISRKKIEK